MNYFLLSACKFLNRGLYRSGVVHAMASPPRPYHFVRVSLNVQTRPAPPHFLGGPSARSLYILKRARASILGGHCERACVRSQKKRHPGLTHVHAVQRCTALHSKKPCIFVERHSTTKCHSHWIVVRS